MNLARGGKSIPMRSGALIPVLLMLPNVAWLLLPKADVGARAAELLSAPLLGLPLPLAVAPAVFLVLSSYLLSSWPMLGVSVLFGVAHIWVSAASL